MSELLDRTALPAEARAADAAALATRLSALLDTLEDVEQGRAFLDAIAAEAPVIEPAADDPLRRLADAYRLDERERELVVLAGLADEHEGYAAVLRTLHPLSEPAATAGLAARLLGRRGLREVLSRRATLVSAVGDRPFFERTLRLPDGLWSALHGVDAWPAGVVVDDGPAPSVGLEDWLHSRTAARAIAAIALDERCTIVVEGDDPGGCLARAAALVSAAGCDPVRFFLHEGTDAAAVSAHAAARGSVVVIASEALDLSGFAAHPGPLLVAGAGAIAGRPLLAVPVARLTSPARRRAWAELLPELSHETPLLAVRHPVDPAAAAGLAADARLAAALDRRPVEPADVAVAVRNRAGAAATTGVQLVAPRASWNALVLRADRKALLVEAVERLGHQARVLDEWGFVHGRAGARGVRMLFSGSPGTGKTLAAEVVASALGVDLLVVDVARVVSKWIGETEKNLATAFDAAERSQAVLLFDEADALFGKRTEIADAHDRYANLETAYLLGRLERFEGLAVLSTNLRQNIDAAFARRLDFLVDFEEPGVDERETLWRGHLPAAAPLADDVSPRELAELYPIVGGLIRNAALAAGFRAAATGGLVTREHLFRAIRREYAKSGRAFPGSPISI
jgi:hypothetical protein